MYILYVLIILLEASNSSLVEFSLLQEIYCRGIFPFRRLRSFPVNRAVVENNTFTTLNDNVKTTNLRNHQNSHTQKLALGHA